MMNSKTSNLKMWLTVLVGAFFFLFQLLQMNIFNSLADSLMQDLQINATVLGFLSGLFFLAIIIFSIPAGHIVDKFSVKRLIIINLIISIIGINLMAISNSLFSLAFGRLMTGIAHAFCFVCCMKLAHNNFHDKQLSLASGLVVTIGMLGGLLAQAPLNFLLQNYTWRQILFIDAGFGFMLLALIATFVFEQVKTNNSHLPNDLHGV